MNISFHAEVRDEKQEGGYSGDIPNASKTPTPCTYSGRKETVFFCTSKSSCNDSVLRQLVK